MLDYTAIDFETANSYRGSPCSVGLVKVRDGVPVDERHWLIRPPERVDRFDPFNVRLHGISAADVADAPRWRDRAPAIVEYVGDDVLATHNAAFDTSVIRYACAADEIAWPTMSFLCTLVLARRAFRLPSYRLPFVAAECGVELVDHHDALADARAVVDVVQHLARRDDVVDLGALAARHGVRMGRFSTTGYERSAGSTSDGHRSALVASGMNPDADPEGPLYGRVVVFTGSLDSMTRQLAWDEVTRLGGTPEQNTTKRTNVLVLGDLSPGSLRPGTEMSAKMRKAFTLQEKGQDIEVMAEDDFLAALDAKELSDLGPLVDSSVL